MAKQSPPVTANGDPASLLPDSPLWLATRRWRRAVLSLIGSLLGPAIVTTSLQPLEMTTSSKIAALLYLIPVMGMSAASGMVFGLLTSLASFAALDYFFTEPVRTFDVPAAEDLVVLGVFIVL